MISHGVSEFLILVPFLLCLASFCYAYDPADSHLIDCGSLTSTQVGDRIFVADQSNSSTLSSPENIFVNTSSKSISSTYDLALYQTARVFSGTSRYIFSIKKHGWHRIRLYIFPIVNANYNLSTAKFSVSTQSFTLLSDYQPESDSVVKEYYLNIASNSLDLTFIPSANSFAFLNALEVISLPDELLPDGAASISPQGDFVSLSTRAVQIVARVNMGNETVSPRNDTLWRLWDSDGPYLKHGNLVTFASNITKVKYTKQGPTQNIAPLSVYGTATGLNSLYDPNTRANVTWLFSVDPGCEYMVRFHFCDIVSSAPGQMVFNVYINSWFVVRDLDISNLTSNTMGVPYYKDVAVRLANSPQLNVSVGPSDVRNAYPNGILNGLEIMKISNSEGSFVGMKSDSSKIKVWTIVAGSAVGLIIIIILAIVLSMVCRRIRIPAHVTHLSQDHFTLSAVESKDSNGTSIISRSKIGYRFPFKVVQQATDNFSENLVIGVGGFGKVYKGVLQDMTKVAIKRGAAQSQQGIAEFRTEIEMLSQFRHRHLVSLIGYCDEGNEMIIVYEYLENGTLKNHLYGSDFLKLGWRQRLEICIGSARGLHYLHTGSAKAIIHRDVKSANILLDENLMAKVADFGLSKTGPEVDQTHVSTAVKGSFGYLDPEYLTRLQLTEKSDVYSFGVVMFEILCGRAVVDPSRPREMVNLVEWAIKCQKSGELDSIIDPHLKGTIRPESLQKFCDVAEKCLAESGVNRPTMGDVLWNLECALQLQGVTERPRPNTEVQYIHSKTGISSTQFSVGSMGDPAGVSISRVFSQMVKAEVGSEMA